MNAAGIRVLPDDLSRIIDADCIGADAAAGLGIVESCVFVNRHDVGSFVILLRSEIAQRPFYTNNLLIISVSSEARRTLGSPSPLPIVAPSSYMALASVYRRAALMRAAVSLAEPR
jgi:hypothetical protein